MKLGSQVIRYVKLTVKQCSQNSRAEAEYWYG